MRLNHEMFTTPSITLMSIMDELNLYKVIMYSHVDEAQMNAVLATPFMVAFSKVQRRN